MTEQDRELLETAAKAAGHSLVWGEKHKLGDDTIDCTDIAYIRSGQSDDGDAYWNPLEDDGDALRLAVKLAAKISHTTDSVLVSIDGIVRSVRSYYGDPYAATRRAIVRAAAEIGRNMP